MTKNKQWFEIKAQGDVAKVYVHGAIGDYGVTMEDFEFAVQDIPESTPVELHLHTDGGSVIEGYAIYIMFNRRFQRIDTVVDGVAASMGSYLFMLGENRRIPSNGWLMIHSPKGAKFGSPEETEAFAQLMYDIKSEMVARYSSASNLSEDEVIEMMKVDTWIRGDKAVEMGLATELEDAFDMAASADIKNLDLSLLASAKEGIIVSAERCSVESGSAKESNANPGASVLKQSETVLVSGSNADIGDFLVSETSRNSKSSAVAGTNPKEEEGVMPEEIKAALNVADNKAAIDDAVSAALALEETRKTDIASAFEGFRDSHGDLLQACLMDQSVTAAQASAKLLKALGENEQPVAKGVTFENGKTGSQRFVEDAQASLLARAGLGKADSSNPLRDVRLDTMAREALTIAGVQSGGMSALDVVGAAFTNTSSDFPVLLENTMHKVLQSAYDTQPDTWSRFCSVGSVSDFRAHNRYRLGSFGNLDSLTEAGEFKNKSIPDGEKSQISVQTKGNIINLTREAIINDDLGAFVGMASNLGRAARRTIESDVYALLAMNGGLGPIMADGNPLFHASRNNIGAGSALTVAGVEADRVLMSKQKDVGDNDFLDLRPNVLLLPVGQGGEARVLNDSQYDPTANNKLQKPNMVRGLYGDIVDSPRLDGTRRYSFADPSIAPVIEVAFLNGEQNPFLDSQEGFTTDGVKWKVRLDYGIAAIDYRGAVTNAGA